MLEILKTEERSAEFGVQEEGVRCCETFNRSTRRLQTFQDTTLLLLAGGNVAARLLVRRNTRLHDTWRFQMF